MANCCDPRGCDRFFGSRFARRMAGRYRKRGLDATAQRMVGFLEQQGIAGATVLEIGGGVGEIHLELLRRGAERAVNLELSPAYDAEAARLASEAGVAGARRAAAARHRRRSRGDRARRHRRPAPRRLLLPRLRAPAGRRRGARAASARLQPPAAQPHLARDRGRGEPRLQALAARVPRLRPPARGDARGARRARVGRRASRSAASRGRRAGRPARRRRTSTAH